MTTSLRRPADSKKDKTKAAQEAENNRRWMEAIIDNLVDGIITFGEHGIIEMINPAGAYIFGYERHELVGKRINLLLPNLADDADDKTLAEFLDHVSNLGDEIELLHDIHERLQPIDALGFAKSVEPLKLFFLEDALAPEDVEWFGHIRAQCATPLAMGELFNNPLEWRSLIEKRLIDFIRMHISAMGGLTPARNAAIFAQIYGIRTAWHGPQDVSPVGHAANLHLDVWAPNFGIQEWCRFPEQVYEMFPGCPEVRDGYMYPNDRPGLGVDIDEKLAAKFPCTDEVIGWTQTRLPDGSPARP